MALPICDFPHSGSYCVSSGWHNLGGDRLPGGPGEPLQVSGVEGPGFRKPVRKETRGEAVGMEKETPGQNHVRRGGRWLS